MFAIRDACALALATCACALAPHAHAARAYDSCTGYIDSLPAVVSAQGTWCLRRDLATSVAAGAAITITAHNVTIDCNDFKLGGLGGGPDSAATGITASGWGNTSIRHCNIRGFKSGLRLANARGALVEDNRFDSQTYAGVEIAGSGSLVRRNTIANTTGGGFAYGIVVEGTADVIGNVVDGVYGPSGTAGIQSVGNVQGSISDNTVRAILGGVTSHGVRLLTASQASVTGNMLLSSFSGTAVAIGCESSTASRARGNHIIDFGTPIVGCRDDGNSP